MTTSDFRWVPPALRKHTRRQSRRQGWRGRREPVALLAKRCTTRAWGGVKDGFPARGGVFGWFSALGGDFRDFSTKTRLVRGLVAVYDRGHHNHSSPHTHDAMKIHLTKPLFVLDCLEDTPALKTIKQLLDTLPDEKLLASLQAARGRGRDDYPVRVRCPAKHEGWKCPMSKVCNAGKSYGLTVRVPREIDLRRFPSLPRATKQFEGLYEGRTAVERLNTRLKVFWGADDGNVTGSRRFFAHLGVVMVVHAAFAVLLAAAPRWEGTLSQTKLTPIAQALHGRPKPKTGRGGTPTSTGSNRQLPSVPSRGPRFN